MGNGWVNNKTLFARMSCKDRKNGNAHKRVRKYR